LKRIGNGIELRLNPANFLVDFFTPIFRVLFRGGGGGIELLIFGRLFDFGFGFAGVAANALEVGGVAFDVFALNAAPGPLRERFVPQSPDGRADQQQRADEKDRAGRAADDRIAFRLGFSLD
jgi:hypothetical protein